MKHPKALFIVVATLFIQAATADQAGSTVQVKSISLRAAERLAGAALAACKQQGFTVSVAVTDRAGVVVAMLRDVDTVRHASGSCIP